VSIGNSHSTSTGTNDKGPYYGHQMRERFYFRELRGYFRCSASGQTFYRWHSVADHWTYAWAQGADVSKYDGYDGYWNANPNYRDVLNRGESVTESKGQSYHYKEAFNAFGASFGSVTTRSTNIDFSMTAGTGRYEHDWWGSNADPYNCPRIAYSF
jgi:hypothetical protein